MSHDHANYSVAQKLSQNGHEIAVHSVTHNPGRDYWKNATTEEWGKEMSGMRAYLRWYANLSRPIYGMRVPHFRVYGENQFLMMQEQGFLYDSSIAAPHHSPPLWPYTLHSRVPHRCSPGQRCPVKIHPVWEMVVNRIDGKCVLDCNGNHGGKFSGNKFYEFLNKKFKRHYEYNRAPFGIYRHWDEFKNAPGSLEILIKWIDDILAKHDDVYFVTMIDVIRWIQNPSKLETVKDFEPWKDKCTDFSPMSSPICAGKVNRCDVHRKNDTKMYSFDTCLPCPKFFPW